MTVTREDLQNLNSEYSFLIETNLKDKDQDSILRLGFWAKDNQDKIHQVLEDRLNQVDYKMLQMSEIPKTGDIIAYNMNDEPFIVCYVEDDYFTDGKTEYHKSCFKGWLPLPPVKE